MQPPTSPKIAGIRNLGPTSAQWLRAIGVETRAELAALGSVNAYHLLKLQGYPVSLNLVYAIEAALLDIHWTHLPPELKASLREQCREGTRVDAEGRPPRAEAPVAQGDDP